jgi:hypothetical protein
MGQPGTHHATISARCWRHFFFWATRRIFGPSRRCRRALALPIVAVCCGFAREEGEWLCVRAQLVGACAARLSV